MVVWKFPLEATHEQYVEMPEGAIILTVQVQRGQPCLWASVDPGREREWIRIFRVGTGCPGPLEDWHYAGTYQLHDGSVVYHVFAAK